MDQKYSQILSKYYYAPGGFQSAKELYALAKKEIPITYSDVRAWLANQSSHSIQYTKKVKHFMPISANRDVPFQRMQMDIMFPELMIVDQGYQCALILVDTFSRYVLAYPMKKKNKMEVVEKFKQALQDMTEKLNVFPPLQVDCDNEGAFISNELKKVFQDNHIQINLSYSGDHRHVAFVDRMIRTLRTKIKKYNEANQNTEWVEPLKNFVEAYNNRKSPTLNLSPNQVVKSIYDDENKKMDMVQVNDKYRMNRKAIKAQSEPWLKTKIKIGDLVRVPLIDTKTDTRFANEKFIKKSLGVWESQPCRVTAIENGVFYRVDRYPLLKFRKYELLPVKESNYAPSVPVEQRSRRQEQLKTVRTNNKVNRERRQLDATPIPQLEPYVETETPTIRKSSRARKQTDFGALVTDTDSFF